MDRGSHPFSHSVEKNFARKCQFCSKIQRFGRKKIFQVKNLSPSNFFAQNIVVDSQAAGESNQLSTIARISAETFCCSDEGKSFCLRQAATLRTMTDGVLQVRVLRLWVECCSHPVTDKQSTGPVRLLPRGEPKFRFSLCGVASPPPLPGFPSSLEASAHFSTILNLRPLGGNQSSSPSWSRGDDVRRERRWRVLYRRGVESEIKPQARFPSS